MKLELKPTLQATLYLALLGVIIWLGIILPKQVIATVFLPIMVGMLWYLLYTIFRERDRALQERDKLRKNNP